MKKRLAFFNALGLLLVLTFILHTGGCSMLPKTTEVLFTGNTASKFLLTNGRVYYEGGQLKLFWTNSGFTFNFDGTGAVMTASANSDRNDPGNSFVNVYVDGSLTPDKTVRFTSLEPAEYVLAENLTPGSHSIRVAKRVQPTQYDRINIGISAVNVTGGSAAFTEPPAAPQRQIEFLGDSITCGQGNLLYDDRDNGGRKGASAEDGTLTYAALTAASFGAANQTLARSGIKFIRRDDTYISPDAVKADGRDSLADYYTKTAAIPSFEANTAEWGFERPSDVVVINLGTNDDGQYSRMNLEMDISAWYQSEAEFLLKLVREKNPEAVIVWCYGMMGENGRTAGPVRNAVKALNAAGDENIYYFSLVNSTALEGRGDGHPTVAGNINRSYDLVRFIAEKTGWDYSFQPQLAAKLYEVNDIRGLNEDALSAYTEETAGVLRQSVSDARALLGNAEAADDDIRRITNKLQSAWRGLSKFYNFLNRDGWTASANLNAAAAGKVLDGRAGIDTERWTTGTEQTEAIKGTWLQIDRGEADKKTFNGIHINYGPSGDYARGSAVFVSDNPEVDWAGDDYTQWSGKAAEGGTNMVNEYNFQESTARYIRIVYTAKGTAAWWSVYEFNAYYQ